MNVIHIEKDGERFVQMPAVQYEYILAKLEDAEDLDAIRLAKESDEETFPAELILEVLKGANPVRVYREHRGLTQSALAEASCVNRVYIGEIESGKKPGSASALKAIATALDVDLDMLVEG